ncbi:phage tail protein [Halomicroarcula sp. GCM10025324]|uniref:phage tail protein n=1 Tax=Haloarcula TaxID=2237 RepID=UPI0023E7D3B9|nr:phage tail protein [Halomicroarcula sp. ZS-22-S1]
MAERVDPYRQLRFILEIDGIVKAGFSHCRVPTASSGVITYREGNELPTPRKLPGLNEYGPLILETGITDSSIELYEWRTLVEQGKMDEARRAAAVVLLDATGQPAARWKFREAWPSQYEGPQLSAEADEVAIERLVIVNEGFGRIAFAESDEESEADSEPTGGVEAVPTGTLPRGVGVPQGIDSLFGTRRQEKQVRDKEQEET